MGCASSSSKKEDIFINFQDPQVTPEEGKTHDQIVKILDKGPTVMERLLNYEGCEELIRKALTTPGPETEDAAWRSVVPAVEKLKELYDYSLEMSDLFPKLLVVLCLEEPKISMEKYQATAKQLARVFDFVLRFDDAKMVNPAIQNDFSYYRRTLNRMKITKKSLEGVKINDELANRMSLFFAYPTPMMKVLTDTTQKLTQQASVIPQDKVDYITATFSRMANACQSMIMNDKYAEDIIVMLCLRAMTGCIILYDQINPKGAFAPGTTIDIKSCIIALGKHKRKTDDLLNSLRFTTVHLNDPETPKSIKQQLDKEISKL